MRGINKVFSSQYMSNNQQKVQSCVGFPQSSTGIVSIGTSIIITDTIIIIIGFIFTAWRPTSIFKICGAFVVNEIDNRRGRRQQN